MQEGSEHGQAEQPQGCEDLAAQAGSARGHRDWDAPFEAQDKLKRTPTKFVANQTEPIVSLERLRFEVPDRTGLASIGQYAHLVLPGGGYRVVGSTEAS